MFSTTFPQRQYSILHFSFNFAAITIYFTPVFFRPPLREQLNINQNNMHNIFKSCLFADYTRTNGQHDAEPSAGGATAAANMVCGEHRKLLEATDLLIDRDQLLKLEEIGKGMCFEMWKKE